MRLIFVSVKFATDMVSVAAASLSISMIENKLESKVEG